MSEEQKKQTKDIVATVMNKMTPVQREIALAYMQGMTAAAPATTAEQPERAG